MGVSLQVVVVSSDLERRRNLATILANLGLDPICASSVTQCRELLGTEHVDLIFCDWFLADGDYCDVLSVCRLSGSPPHLVLACHHTNADYHQAMAQGVLGVITAPCLAAEVEWMLIQAKRKERPPAPSASSRGTADLAPNRKIQKKVV